MNTNENNNREPLINIEDQEGGRSVNFNNINDQEANRMSLNTEQRLQAERNMQHELSGLISRSNAMKITSAIISISKIIASIIMLSKYSFSCLRNNCLAFFYTMLVHDSLNIFYVISYWIYSKFFLDHDTMRNDYQNQLINQIDAQYNPNQQNNNRREDLVETQCKSLGGLKEFNKLLYLGLLIWGHTIYFTDESRCVGDNPLNNLLLGFIIMGYIYVLYPIFLVICLCLCLPFLILLIYFLGGTSQKPAENQAINNLKPTRYLRKEFPADAETDCIICKVEYSEEDEIIVLPCNQLHFFHTDCIKTWLKINGLCPICRARLAEEKK